MFFLCTPVPKQCRDILNPSQPALKVNAGRETRCLYSQGPWVGRGTVGWGFRSIRRDSFLRLAPSCNLKPPISAHHCRSSRPPEGHPFNPYLPSQ